MENKLGEYIKEYSVRNKNGDDIPVYSVTNSKGFCKNYFGKDVASKDKTTYKIVPRGYFAYNPSRINVGSVDWQRNEDNVIVSPLYNVFSVSDRLKQQYLYYYLKSDKVINRIKFVATGSVRDNLKLSFLYEFPINVPKLKKQEKIINILDKLSLIIQLKKEILDEYEELIKARFVEMFGDPIDNDMNWNVKSIGDISKEIKYGTSKPAVLNGKYPYLRMNNISYEGELDLKDLKYINIDDDELEKCAIKKGDILFNRTNSRELCGKTCLYKLDKTMIIAGYIIRVRINTDILDPVYVVTFFNTKPLKKLLANMAKGAVNQANINAQELKSIRIEIPPLKLQKEFASFVEQVDKSKVVQEFIVDYIDSCYNKFVLGGIRYGKF